MRKQKYFKFNQLVLLKLPSSQSLNIRSIKSIPLSVTDMNVLFPSTASCLVLSKAWINIDSAEGPFPKDDGLFSEK